MVSCPVDVQILDLSENKLDAVSARSLSTFFRSPRCRLREVFLAKADIDDEEMAIIMEVRYSVTYLGNNAHRYRIETVGKG